MAKAYAICTCKTCGETFEMTTSKSNRREAVAWEEWAASNIVECPECAAKRIQAQRAAENAKAKEEAEASGFPELQGTERQVAWANTIRAKFVALADELMESAKAEKDQDKRAINEAIAAMVKRRLLAHVKASWYIDNRDGMYEARDVISLLKNEDRRGFKAELNEIKSRLGNDTPSVPAPKMPREDDIGIGLPETKVAVPETERHDGVVGIEIKGAVPNDIVCATFEKDNEFMEVVKSLGFKWERPCWMIKANEMTGTPEDIAADLTHALLQKGFKVSAPAAVVDKAASGDFQKRKYRWIAYLKEGAKIKTFLIYWEHDADDQYRKAKKLPGAEWRREKQCMAVSSEHWAAVFDFAEENGYSLTTAAQRLAEWAKEREVRVSLSKEQGEEPVFTAADDEVGIIPDLIDN